MVKDKEFYGGRKKSALIKIINSVSVNFENVNLGKTISSYCCK